MIFVDGDADRLQRKKVSTSLLNTVSAIKIVRPFVINIKYYFLLIQRRLFVNAAYLIERPKPNYSFTNNVFLRYNSPTTAIITAVAIVS